MGAALIAVGMLASQLSSNVTIAFILGAVFCSFGVFIEAIAGTMSVDLARWVAPLGVFHHFEDFSRGVISFTGLLYFVSVAAVFLYLNVLAVSKRHWPREADGVRMSTHHLIRAVSVVVLLVAGDRSIVSRLGHPGRRYRRTPHSLSRETKTLHRPELDSDRPVFVQAYISPTVPEQYVQTRANVVGLLKEVASSSGGRVQIAIYDTEPFSEEAREAREKFGIQPREIPNLQSARAGFTEVFLGLAFTCGGEEQVIPFFDRGLPAEYEIARSIRVVANTERKTIGVINTQLRACSAGSTSKRCSRRRRGRWWRSCASSTRSCRSPPTAPSPKRSTACWWRFPSSLTQEQMDNVAAFIRQGTPALLLLDPLPVVNLGPRTLRAARREHETRSCASSNRRLNQGGYPRLPHRARLPLGPVDDHVGRVQPPPGLGALAPRGRVPRPRQPEPRGLQRQPHWRARHCSSSYCCTRATSSPRRPRG